MSFYRTMKDYLFITILLAKTKQKRCTFSFPSCLQVYKLAKTVSREHGIRSPVKLFQFQKPQQKENGEQRNIKRNILQTTLWRMLQKYNLQRRRYSQSCFVILTRTWNRLRVVMAGRLAVKSSKCYHKMALSRLLGCPPRLTLFAQQINLIAVVSTVCLSSIHPLNLCKSQPISFKIHFSIDPK